MKKVLSLTLVLLICFFMTACSQGSNEEKSTPASTIKLLGEVIPKPSMDYDVINSSKESIYLTVSNASENDFRSYVDSCKTYGFDGEIKSATVPDLYFREYNSENYFLEIRFTEADQEFSIYVNKSKK